MALQFLRNRRLNQISKPPCSFLEVDEDLERRFFECKDAVEDPLLIWAFGMAAPLNAKNNNPCNCFLWGGTPEDWQEQLKADWGVENVTDYKQLMNEFLLGYHSLNDADLIPLLKEKNSTTIYKKLMQAGYKEEFAQEYSLTIPIVSRMFQNSNWFQIPTKSLQAWDLVRASYYVLCGECAKYIGQAEAIVYLEKFGIIANQYYEDWFSYTSAYLYGRKLWIGTTGGYGDESVISMDIDFERLTTFTCSSKSVCRTIPFGYEAAKKLGCKYLEGLS